MKSQSRENIWSLSQISKPSSSFQQQYNCRRHFSEQKKQNLVHPAVLSAQIFCIDAANIKRAAQSQSM